MRKILLRLDVQSIALYRAKDVAKGREEIFGEFWNVVLDEKWEDQMDRQTEKRGDAVKSERGKNHIGH